MSVKKVKSLADKVKNKRLEAVANQSPQSATTDLEDAMHRTVDRYNAGCFAQLEPNSTSSRMDTELFGSAIDRPPADS